MGFFPEPAQSCRHQPACPGCPHFGVEGIAAEPQRRLKELAVKAGAPQPEFLRMPGLGSRHRARLSVRGRPGQVGIGIFEARSHRLVSICDCPLHHPSLVEVTLELQRLLNRAKLTPYQEPPRAGQPRGTVRAVQLAVERHSQKVQVALVAFAAQGEHRTALDACRELLAELAQHPRVGGTFLNFQPLPTNTLLGEVFEHVAGPEVLEDVSFGARVFYPPGAFGQAHPFAHDRAVELIARAVGERPVMEYYAGVGTIGLGLAQRGNQVWFNEIGPGSLQGLRLGLACLADDAQTRLLPGRAEEHARSFVELGREVAVVVDPPRKGLGPEMLAALAADPPAELLYLSCGVASLERDTEVLVRAGLRLTEVTGLPYFPYTEHVETLCRFLHP